MQSEPLVLYVCPIAAQQPAPKKLQRERSVQALFTGRYPSTVRRNFRIDRGSGINSMPPLIYCHFVLL